MATEEEKVKAEEFARDIVARKPLDWVDNFDPVIVFCPLEQCSLGPKNHVIWMSRPNQEHLELEVLYDLKEKQDGTDTGR